MSAGGHLENAVTFSPVQLVIDNEVARYVRRAVRTPWVVDEQTFATDLIRSVGPGGNYPGESHTAEDFRKELYLPPLFVVRPWVEAHNKPHEFDQSQKAHQIASELWRKPLEPVLNEDQIREIDRIVLRATHN